MADVSAKQDQEMSSIQAKFTLTFEQPISFFVLVMGGWYPLAFVPNCVLALDRNILKLLHHLEDGLILICVLSCLYERNDGAEPLIGRKIIKPCDSYSNENAHNAISDLRALEMLAATNGLNIGCASFCTGDKHLAAMWCGLKISSPKWSGNQFTCSINPEPRCYAFS